MDRPESWRKIVAEMRNEDTGTRFVSGDGMIASLHAAQAELRKLADRVQAACEALEVSRDSVDASTYSAIVARDDAVGKLRDVVVRAMGTCTTCKRTDCDTCINMNSYWIPGARAALAAAKGETVTKCNGFGTMTLDEAIEHAESKSDDTPCGLEHAALAGWLRELRQYKNGKCGNASKLREALRIANNAHWFHMNPALRELVADALSAPPRNCDVGTAEEQAQRFFAFCHDHRAFDTACSNGCPFKDTPDINHCQSAWGQLPYKAEGDKP